MIYYSFTIPETLSELTFFHVFSDDSYGEMSHCINNVSVQYCKGSSEDYMMVVTIKTVAFLMLTSPKIFLFHNIIAEIAIYQQQACIWLLNTLHKMLQEFFCSPSKRNDPQT